MTQDQIEPRQVYFTRRVSALFSSEPAAVAVPLVFACTNYFGWKYVPSHLALDGTNHLLIFSIILLLYGLVGYRLILVAVSIFDSGSSTKRQFTAFIAKLIVAVVLHSFVYEQVLLGQVALLTKKLQNGESGAQSLVGLIQLKESRFEVTVLCDGNAKIVRTQTFVPNVNLSRFPETDFYSSGGLARSDFSDTTFLMDPKSKQPKRIESSLDLDGATGLVEVFPGADLEAGKLYTRVMHIDARCAFADTLGDAFLVNVNYGSEQLTVTVRFEGGCLVNDGEAKFQQIKDHGTLLATPKEISTSQQNSDKLSFYLVNPNIGDKYAIKWKYRLAQKPNLSPECKKLFR